MRLPFSPPAISVESTISHSADISRKYSDVSPLTSQDSVIDIFLFLVVSNRSMQYELHSVEEAAFV